MLDSNLQCAFIPARSSEYFSQYFLFVFSPILISSFFLPLVFSPIAGFIFSCIIPLLSLTAFTSHYWLLVHVCLPVDVGLIIDWNICSNLRNSLLWTPLDCAAARGHTKVAGLLLEFDSPVDPTDKAKVLSKQILQLTVLPLVLCLQWF